MTNRFFSWAENSWFCWLREWMIWGWRFHVKEQMIRSETNAIIVTEACREWNRSPPSLKEETTPKSAGSSSYFCHLLHVSRVNRLHWLTFICSILEHLILSPLRSAQTLRSILIAHCMWKSYVEVYRCTSSYLSSTDVNGGVCFLSSKNQRSTAWFWLHWTAS